MGRFAEPPSSIGKQQLSETDVNYSNNQQSSYDATPKARSPTKRNKAPTKVNSKRVTTKSTPVSLNADEELLNNNDDDSNGDYIGESYSYFKTIPQPTLPNAYDQEEFHSVGKNKRKSQHRPGFFRDDDRPRSTTRKPTVTLRIPDDDYVDDLIKVVQTTKRPKKKLVKPTVSHILDTEDLREAYDSDVAYYPKAKKTGSSFINSQTGDYDISAADTDDDSYDDYDNNDRTSHDNGKDNKEKRTVDKDLNSDQSSPQSASYWDKESSIYKQYGIRARNDNFQNGQRFRVGGLNGFRPIRGEDRLDVFPENPTDGKGHYLHDIGIVAEGSYSTAARPAGVQRTTVVTTPKSTTIFVWDGKQMPKNHKMV